MLCQSKSLQFFSTFPLVFLTFPCGTVFSTFPLAFSGAFSRICPVFSFWALKLIWAKTSIIPAVFFYSSAGFLNASVDFPEIPTVFFLRFRWVRIPVFLRSFTVPRSFLQRPQSLPHSYCRRMGYFIDRSVHRRRRFFSRVQPSGRSATKTPDGP